MLIFFSNTGLVNFGSDMADLRLLHSLDICFFFQMEKFNDILNEMKHLWDLRLNVNPDLN